jgi:hypothetical protein
LNARTKKKIKRIKLSAALDFTLKHALTKNAHKEKRILAQIRIIKGENNRSTNSVTMLPEKKLPNDSATYETETTLEASAA